MPPSICLTLLLHLIFINFIFFSSSYSSAVWCRLRWEFSWLLTARSVTMLCVSFLCFDLRFSCFVLLLCLSICLPLPPNYAPCAECVCVCACLMFNETNLHRISYVVRRHTERRIRSRWPIYVPTFVLLSQMLTFIHISLRMVPYTICVNVSKVFSFQKLVARFFFFRIHWYILVCVFFNFMFSFSSRLCLCACSDVPATLTGKQLKKLPNQNGYKVKERPTCIDLRIPEVCQSDTSI